MIETTQSQTNEFTTDFSQYSMIGYHATSSTACSDIETNGFLPKKILQDSDHRKIIELAKTKNISTSEYERWLEMKSVTFAKKSSDAIAHIRQGKASGQGIFHIEETLSEIAKSADAAEIEFIDNCKCKIKKIKDADCVVYAVDLSSLEKRIDKTSANEYFYRLNPEIPTPQISDVKPSLIIEKLFYNHKNSPQQ